MRAGAVILAGLLWIAAFAEGTARKFISMKGGDFSRERLVRLARQALRGRSRSLVQVTFFGEGGGPPLPKPSHFDFERWRAMFEMVAQKRMQIAEAISVNGNAVMRIHQADGSVTREILSGRDPLKLTLGGREFEIVYLGFSGPSRFGLQESVFVFVRSSSPLDLTLGPALFNRIEPLFPGLGVVVEIRNDAWFVYQQRYPFFNPFNPDRDIPSQHEYEGSQTMRCTGGTAGPHCELLGL